MSVLLCNSACACVGALRHLYICTIMFLGIGGSVMLVGENNTGCASRQRSERKSTCGL